MDVTFASGYQASISVHVYRSKRERVSTHHSGEWVQPDEKGLISQTFVNRHNIENRSVFTYPSAIQVGYRSNRTGWFLCQVLSNIVKLLIANHVRRKKLVSLGIYLGFLLSRQTGVFVHVDGPDALEFYLAFNCWPWQQVLLSKQAEQNF